MGAWVGDEMDQVHGTAVRWTTCLALVDGRKPGGREMRCIKRANEGTGDYLYMHAVSGTGDARGATGGLRIAAGNWKW